MRCSWKVKKVPDIARVKISDFTLELIKSFKQGFRKKKTNMYYLLCNKY